MVHMNRVLKELRLGNAMTFKRGSLPISEGHSFMKGVGAGDMKLVVPAVAYLSSYTAALERGWSPDNVIGRKAAAEQLRWIAYDPGAFLASFEDPEARGALVERPDGTMVRRLPSIGRWMWDGEFCGSIGFRWEHGTAELPAGVLGHIGFGVVPWKRRRGIGTAALALMLVEARTRGLPFVELTTTPDNTASRRIIEVNGGVLVGQFQKDGAYGGGEALRFRIALQ